MKTFTEEEVAELQKQLELLKAKVEEFESEQHASKVEAQVAEATKEADEKIAALQAELDTAVLEAQAANQAKDEILAWLEAEAKSAEEKAALESRRDERLTKVREIFSDETYIEKNADRFVAMDEETFEAALEDWRAVAPQKTEGTIPVKTAMVASREDTSSEKNALREVMGLRFKGIDTRNV